MTTLSLQEVERIDRIVLVAPSASVPSGKKKKRKVHTGKVVPIPSLMYPKNSLCPCESGKKFKRCCGKGRR